MEYLAIIDYNLGNVRSVQKAFDYLGIPARLTKDEREIRESAGVLLPGVGAFPYAIKKLKEYGMYGLLREQAAEKPLLGVCLGMQLLFDKSYEVEEGEGLRLIPGEIVRFQPGELKIPHMGWNSLAFTQTPCPLLDGVPEGTYVYFVHSYYARMGAPENLCAYAEYGVPVPAIVRSGTVYGAQFHPEKSGDAGLKMLQNFGALCGVRGGGERL